MGDLQGRKVFKVFNQDFIVDERYTVTKELGQGAYGIVWYVSFLSSSFLFTPPLKSEPGNCTMNVQSAPHAHIAPPSWDFARGGGVDCDREGQRRRRGGTAGTIPN